MRRNQKKSTSGSAGYDLFAAEEKTLFPHRVTPFTIELKMEIPHGHFGKIYPRSSLLKNYFVSCDAGAIASDYRGTILLLMTNNGNIPLLVNEGQRIAQIVLHKKQEFVFRKVNCLKSTERGAGGFGSRGIKFL